LSDVVLLEEAMEVVKPSDDWRSGDEHAIAQHHHNGHDDLS
jgi:hypothetical protein